MRRAVAVAFLALTAIPLLEAPGFGPDSLRLPATALAITVLLLGGVVLAMKRRDSGTRSDPLRTAAALFLATALLSLVGAQNRGNAFVPLVVLWIGFCSYLVVRGESREFLSRTGTVAIAVVGLAFGTCAIGQWILGKPATATLGNTNLAGGLAAMFFPFVVAMASGSTRRFLYVLSAVALFGAVLATQARGAMVGALLGCGVAAGAIAWRRKESKGILWVLLGVTVAMAATAPTMIRRSDTVQVRWGLWKGAWNLFLESPFVGCGIGGFSTEFPPHRREEEFRITNPRPDVGFVEAEDAHSTWVQLAAETGVLGILAFLGVVTVAVKRWRYSVAQTTDRDTAALLAGAGGGAVAFLAAGFFNTLHLQVSHLLYFFLFLGLVEQGGDERVRRKKGGPVRLAATCALALVGLFSAVATGWFAMSDRYFQRAMRVKEARDRVEPLRRAIDLHYGNWKAHAELARAYSAATRPAEAGYEFGEVLRLRPHHVESMNGLALARIRAGAPASEIDPLFDRAIRIAPFYFKTYYNRGAFRERSRDWAGARAMYGEAIRCRPEHGPSYASRGVAAAAEGDRAAALEDFRRARALDPALVEALRSEQPRIAAEPYFAEIFGRE